MINKFLFAALFAVSSVAIANDPAPAETPAAAHTEATPSGKAHHHDSHASAGHHKDHHKGPASKGHARGKKADNHDHAEKAVHSETHVTETSHATTDNTAPVK